MSWQEAFARQAKSDLAARDALLEKRDLPACHQLHYLQMACEKLAKAHLIATGSNPLEIQQSHCYVAKQIPIIAKNVVAREAGRLRSDTWIVRAIHGLAQQIEMLSPSCDDGGRTPSNCEYPWVMADGRVVAPAQFNFALDSLHGKAGVKLVKIVGEAIDELIENA